MIFLWYVVHVCKRSFISPFIQCILCFMWLGLSHLFSYKYMYAGGVNFTSLLFMNVYHIYLYCLFFLRLFVDELTKRRRSIWRVYICIFISLFMQKGGEEFGNFMHVYILVYAYMLCLFYVFIKYPYCLCYA